MEDMASETELLESEGGSDDDVSNTAEIEALHLIIAFDSQRSYPMTNPTSQTPLVVNPVVSDQSESLKKRALSYNNETYLTRTISYLLEALTGFGT